MRTTVPALLLLFGVTLAANMHFDQLFAETEAAAEAQVSYPADCAVTSWFGGTSPLETYMCLLDDLTIDECYSAIQLTEYGMELTLEDFAWKLLGQPLCWAKYSEAYGYTHISDWDNDPFCEEWWAFQMPNSRLYEHFYNDPECNQTWRMGRGREQPDAITFYDVPKHDHNKLLMLNRIQVTPWVTHDVMVLQFFGVTNECVEIEPDVVLMNRGLVAGQFRIEYKSSLTGEVLTVTGDDFGIALNPPETGFSTGPPVITATMGSLLANWVWVCRTPHYLAICEEKSANAHRPLQASCTSGCEYWPDFTSTDDSLAPFVDSSGQYTVPCDAGNVLSFNGTASDADDGIKVKSLSFEDKCENDAFVFTSGQRVDILGNLTGHLEVLLEVTANTTDYEVFSIQNSADHTQPNYIVLKSDIVTLQAASAAHDQLRVWVYSKFGVTDICFKGCEAVPADLCMTIPVATDLTALLLDPTAMDDVWHYDGVAEAASIALLAGNDYAFLGPGNDTLMGGDDNDIIITGQTGFDTLMGEGGEDLLISYSGYDLLTGGGDGVLQNTFRVYPTHEKNYHFGIDTTEVNTCTKVLDMFDVDTIELFMDDPTAHDYWYTTDDDTCAIDVHGWELEWFWRSDTAPDFSGAQMIDVWFSRKTEMADLCLSDSATDCTGPYNLSPMMGQNCFKVMVTCPDLDPWPEVTLDDYLVTDSWLDWYGWW